MRRKWAFVIGAVSGVIGVLLICNWTSDLRYSDSRQDASRIEYRTDREPIDDRLPDLPQFSKCFWKADTIGRTDFGPTNYWMSGFIVLEQEAVEELLRTYVWGAGTPEFLKGIDPEITDKNGFEWKKSNDFASDIFRNRFAGNRYSLENQQGEKSLLGDGVPIGVIADFGDNMS